MGSKWHNKKRLHAKYLRLYPTTTYHFRKLIFVSETSVHTEKKEPDCTCSEAVLATRTQYDSSIFQILTQEPTEKMHKYGNRNNKLNTSYKQP